MAAASGFTTPFPGAKMESFPCKPSNAASLMGFSRRSGRDRRRVFERRVFFSNPRCEAGPNFEEMEVKSESRAASISALEQLKTSAVDRKTNVNFWAFSSVLLGKMVDLCF